MSGSGGKHSSKWDLSDELEFACDSKQLRFGWSSADVAGSNSSKWSYMERNDRLKPRMGFSSKEPFSGGRGSNKDDIINTGYRILDATIACDTDGSYSIKMSPGFEEWKHKRHSHSPKNGCSRSIRVLFVQCDDVLQRRRRSWNAGGGGCARICGLGSVPLVTAQVSVISGRASWRWVCSKLPTTLLW